MECRAWSEHSSSLSQHSSPEFSSLLSYTRDLGFYLSNPFSTPELARAVTSTDSVSKILGWESWSHTWLFIDLATRRGTVLKLSGNCATRFKENWQLSEPSLSLMGSCYLNMKIFLNLTQLFQVQAVPWNSARTVIRKIGYVLTKWRCIL